MAQNTRDLVMSWCAAEGMNPTAVDSAKLPADVEWGIVTHPEKDRTLTIAQRKSAPHRIEVSASLVLADAHAAAFQALDMGQKARFLLSLRRDVMLLGVAYQGLSDPLVKTGFVQRLYVNDLTQTGFMTAFLAVQSALMIVRGFVQVHLGPGDTGTGVTDIEPDGPFGDFLEGLDLGGV